MTKKFASVAAAAASVALIAPLSSCASSDGSNASDSKPGMLLGVFNTPNVIHAGLADDAFDNVDLDARIIDSGPEVLPLVKRGDMTGVVNLSATPLLLGVENNIPLTIVWTTSATGYRLVVNSDIASADDLRGKKVATVPGSILEYVLDEYLADNGLSDSDIEKVDLPPASMPAAFKTGQIDAGFVWEPFASQMVTDGGTDIAQDSDTGYIALSSTFVEDNPDTVQSFVCDLYDAQSSFLADPDAGYQKVAERIEQDPAVVGPIMQANTVYPADQAVPDLLGNDDEQSTGIGEIVAQSEWLTEKGKLQAAVSSDDVAKLFDASFAANATAGDC